VIRPEPGWEDIAPISLLLSGEVPLNKSELSPALLQVISEAVTWCFYRQLSVSPYRSLELDPSAILAVPDFPHDKESIKAWIEGKRDCYRRATSWINHARSELLKAMGIETIEAVDALSRSKLLIYEPMETVDDGASEAASMGFYDPQDAPPWDTWFLYADRAVCCCVPEFSISRAQDGIDANIVDCIHWANWSQLTRIEN
jgi:hypothetical protein